MKTKQDGGKLSDLRTGKPCGKCTGIYRFRTDLHSLSVLLLLYSYDFQKEVELYDLVNDVGENTDVSADNPDAVKLAVQYMDEAHIPGPRCGYRPPHPNSLPIDLDSS